MRWAKYLEPYPLSTIADFVGVQPATVRRWERAGKIPERHDVAIRDLKKRVKVAGPRARKRSLRHTDTETIAELVEMSGAKRPSRKQIAAWKRAGDIPREFRGAWVDAHYTKPVKRHNGHELQNRIVTYKKFTFADVYEVTWTIEQKLTEHLLSDMLVTASQAKVRGTDKKQFMVKGSVEIALASDSTLSYVMGALIFSAEEVKIERWTEQWRDSKKAVRSLAIELGKLIKQGMFVEELVLVITRERK